MGRPKRGYQGGQVSKQKRAKVDRPQRSEGSHEEILGFELRSFFPASVRSPGSSESPPSPPEPFTQVHVSISRTSSTGDGLGEYEHNGHKFTAVVPFSLPGDVVEAKVIRHSKPPHPQLTSCDFVKVITPSADRDDSLIRCRYFAKCGGCHFQMLPYDKQLAHKRTIVERAYANFSGLQPETVPAVGDTMGSPLQYGYRTKLTPHFDGPPGGRRAARHGERPKFSEVPPIGFMLKGTRRTLDIEECPIATDVVQAGLKRERERVSREIDKYQRGATILLRESTERVEEDATFKVNKTCVTDNRGTSTEYIDDYVFQNPANAFFQNNNSILPSFTDYVRRLVQPGAAGPQIKNLIDAYSGSGLFTITLHSLFAHSIGIDISAESIDFARRNARLNGVAAAASNSPEPSPSAPENTEAKTRNVRFLAGDANTLFAAVPASFNPAETVVILDPPRKGCDEGFLRQLVAFAPARIVYVSCNVHTQARDVGWILNNTQVASDGGEALQSRYQFESLRGFDFFPQTSHVEGVAVLARRGSVSSSASS